MAITNKIDFIIDEEFIITGRGIWNLLNHTFNLPARQPLSYPFNHEWLISLRPHTSNHLHTIVEIIQARETAAATAGNDYGLIGTFIWVTGARREVIEERGDLLFQPRVMKIE
ncbi:hypothetical protein BGZ95_002492 [Linnemannia exigua]|uniref:Uncharacterized protein n=1 Tax=Linnemannia exigua TaxID=604196 RepID=A0AAD4D5V9_9FUNG|nr:hypothetical protein BGZ95_002492 [Linnemannia exigua]